MYKHINIYTRLHMSIYARSQMPMGLPIFVKEIPILMIIDQLLNIYFGAEQFNRLPDHIKSLKTEAAFQKALFSSST